MLYEKYICVKAMIWNILFTLALIFSASAYAANWVTASININGTVYYVDADSLYETNEGYIAYWSKTLWKNERQIPGQTYKIEGKKIWYTKGLAVEDCNNGLTSENWLQYAHYGLNHEIIGSNSGYLPTMRLPFPESSGEGKHKYVCSLWQEKQEAVSRPAEQPKPVYLDFTRWKVIDSYDEGKVLLLTDTKSLEKCSYITGNSCNVSSYGEPVGYKFWLTLSNSKGLQLLTPFQAVIDCNKRKFDGKEIVPQGPAEPVFNAVCSK